jgi:protocatechuate 3,4-dioxygenase, alpha subunit
LEATVAEQAPGPTPSQTVGPFLHLALGDHQARYAVPAGSPGAIVVRGRVVDGAGQPVADALVETWQADGRFARCATDDDGWWEVHTVKPPPIRTRDGTPQAPHLAISVFARGLLDRVVTRCYFGDETGANDADPTLALCGPDRRRLLIAPAEAGTTGRFRFDIRLQGEDESVFFAV